MIKPRPIVPSPDLCCLPTPYRIPQFVAGMAFNFSKIEISHHRIQRKAPLPAQPDPNETPASAEGA